MINFSKKKKRKKGSTKLPVQDTEEEREDMFTEDSVKQTTRMTF